MIVDVRTPQWALIAPYIEAMPIGALRILGEAIAREARRPDPSVTDPARVVVTRSWPSMADTSAAASTRTRIDATSPVKEGRWIR